jgi:NADH:ubiquinone oxidoreductase subunit 5 (subunit L)/multisubunit Na+/H+ antiporter MnhA subunit
MPMTAALFAVGAIAIAALPPLNGFVSEWLLLQSLVGGARSSGAGLALAMPVAVAAVALTTGLVAATFVKAFGTGFLAQPRSPEAAEAHEAPATMRAGMAFLAVACLALGVGAPILRIPLEHVAGVVGVRGRLPLAPGVLTLGETGSAVAPLTLAFALLVTVTLLAAVRRVAGGRPRVAEAWGCGRTHMTARMEYTATSFAEPLARVFDDVLQPELDLDVTHKEESAYFVEAMRFRSGIRDGIERRIYLPVVRWVRVWGRAARVVQSGSVNLYLGYAFVALLVVLLVAR